RCVARTYARELDEALADPFLTIVAAEVLCGVRLGFGLVLGDDIVAADRRLVADRRLDETARREPLLDLVERLLAEVAHPQQLVVRGLQELADLRDAVPLQRVEGALREVEVLDGHVRDRGR